MIPAFYIYISSKIFLPINKYWILLLIIKAVTEENRKQTHSFIKCWASFKLNIE